MNTTKKTIQLFLVLALMSGGLWNLNSCKDDNSDILEKIDKVDKSLSDKIEALSKTMGDITNALQALTDKVGGLATKEDVAAVKDVVDKLTTALAQVSTTVGTLKDDISADVKAQLATQLEAIQTAMGALQTALENKIAASDAETAKQYKGLLDKLEALKTQLTELQKEVEKTHKDVKSKGSFQLDPFFAQYLRTKIPGAFVYTDEEIEAEPKKAYLINKNSSLLLDLKDIDVSGEEWNKIKSLEGVKFFLNLKNLNADNTKISEVDVSKNVNLKNLNVSNTTNLKNIVGLNYTQIDTLTADNTGLESFEINSNKTLKTLFFNDNSKLASLTVSSNAALTQLKANNNASSISNGNFNFEGNNALTDLEVHNNIGLNILSVKSNNALTTLNAYDNAELTTFTVSSNTALNKLIAYGNATATGKMINSLDLSTNTSLATLDVGTGKHTPVTKRSVIAGKYFSTNIEKGTAPSNIKSLNVSNTQIEELYVNDHKNLQTLLLANIKKGQGQIATLKVLGAARTNLTELDVSTAHKLVTLDVRGYESNPPTGNKLEKLVLYDEENKDLKTLVIRKNKIEGDNKDRTESNKQGLYKTQLALLVGLKNLDCAYNGIKGLYLHAAPNLEKLNCESNSIIDNSHLVLSTNTYSDNKHLNYLNIKGNVNLGKTNSEDPKTGLFNVKNCKKLKLSAKSTDIDGNEGVDAVEHDVNQHIKYAP